jgi:putative DNA primase/helicase
LIFQVVRYEPKTFRQRRPARPEDASKADGDWVWSMNGVRRVLFRLPQVLAAAKSGDVVYVVEGEKDVIALGGLGFVATTNPGGARKWQKEYTNTLKGCSGIVVLPDNDESGRSHANDIAQACVAAGIPVKVVTLPGLPHKGDVSDWIDAGHTADDLYEVEKATPHYVPLPVGGDGANAAPFAGISPRAEDQPDAASPMTHVYKLSEFLALDLPPREPLLVGEHGGGVLREKDLAMLYASRGVGKTWITLGLAHAVASGGQFLRWRAPKPRSVLVVDGEMPTVALQERLRKIAGPATDVDLRMLPADAQEIHLQSLVTHEGQARVEAQLDGVRLLIMDNISCLMGGLDENDAGEWEPVQTWLLSLRRRGIAVLLAHHASKQGGQRGTSRREDVLDIVIRLARPEDYRADQGARFEVHIDKGRDLYGRDAAPFEAWLRPDGWAVSDVGRSIKEKELERRIVAFVRKTGAVSTRQVREGVSGRSKAIGDALTRLAESGDLEYGKGKYALPVASW